MDFVKKQQKVDLVEMRAGMGVRRVYAGVETTFLVAEEVAG